MKKKSFWVFAFIPIIGMLGSCKEEQPGVDFSVPPIDTSYIDPNVEAGIQLKNVLIEDFGGVKCSSCPKAQRKATEIASSNPGRVVIVAIHPGGPWEANCSPFNDANHKSKYDFRNTEGLGITQLIGALGGLPAGAINRKLVGGARTNTQYNDWPATATSELSAGSPCKIEFIKKELDTIAGKLVIRVKITYTAVETDINYLTIGLTESGLIDLQEDGPVIVEEYEHNHVLRDMITDFRGNLLSGSKTVGRVIEKEFTVVYPNKIWVNAKNLHVYALVHKDAAKLDVVQCAETELK